MRRVLMTLCIFSLTLFCKAQDNDVRQRYEEFRRNARESYENLRDEANRRYAEFKEEAWKEYEKLPGIRKPKDEVVPPVVLPEDDADKPIESNPLPIEGVITPPRPEPQPTPVNPINEQPRPAENYVSFTYCGTECKVRFDKAITLSLGNCSNAKLTSSWEALSTTDFNNTLRDCLELRKRMRLSDWAYLNLINCFSEECFGKGADANFMTAYIFCQSGYKMRLGRAGSNVWLLFGSKHVIYDDGYYQIDDYRYYPFNCKEESMEIYDMPFAKEQPMSLLIHDAQLFDSRPSISRNLISERYPDVNVSVNVNLNLIDFFNTYPASETDGNFMTRWAMYANTPLDEEVKKTLYPQLQECISGLNQKDAANKLLNWVQTAFVYQYDNVVWGCDRAFFAEESIYYPYCDCEDRSILFSRLVRDLLGLKVVLVYYPGHLATAVNFGEDVEGDYIMLNGARFVISDPTYIGAPVGMTMEGMDNVSATVILID